MSTPVPSGPGAKRLYSLDVFRGLTLAAMILVNNPGQPTTVYRVLRHANWNGYRPADFIFPFFLFVVGAAIHLALPRRLHNDQRGAKLLTKILRRTLLLLALGLLLNGFPRFDLSELRIPGILQRIALCYAVAALIVASCGWRGQLFAALALLLVYGVLMLWVPVPELGAGVLRPGKDFASYIDRCFLSSHHLLFPRWDPEGLGSTLPAIATTLSGALTAQWLRTRIPPFWQLVLVAVPLMAIGLLADAWLPINKTLWTPSYVALTSGAAILGLGFCHWLIDVRGVRAWAQPWAALGANPIVLYVLSTLCDKLLLLWRVVAADGSVISLKHVVFTFLTLHVGSPHSASLLYAGGYLLVWMAVAESMYRANVLIRL
jgi:predicted acyltransferase